MSLRNNIKIDFRDFKIEDYDLLIEIWNKSDLAVKLEGRDSLENISEELKKGIAHFLFAIVEKKIVGTVLLTHDGRKGWINRLAVLPEYRNLGIAKALVEKAENTFHQQGIDIIACLIEDYNTSSLEIFEKLGYVDFKGIHYLTKRKHPDI